MLPLPGHLASGYILAYLLHRVGLCDGFMFYGMWVPTFYIVIIASVLPDADYLIRHSHRDFATHTPFFWLCLLTLFIIWQHQYIVILLAAMLAVMLHLVMDTIDWGVMLLYPISKKKYGLKILPIPENLEDVPQTYFFKSYLSNRKLVFFEILLACIAALLFAMDDHPLSNPLLNLIILLEFISFIGFIVYWKTFDKHRKRFLGEISSMSELKPLADISLTTAISMAALAGIMLSLLFGFMISASQKFISEFTNIMVWILVICFISTASFIGSSTAYHMSEYAGKSTKNGENFEPVINIFRVGVFLYVLGTLLFLLTSALLILIVMVYFRIDIPFAIRIMVFHIPVVIFILYFSLKPVFRLIRR